MQLIAHRLSYTASSTEETPNYRATEMSQEKGELMGQTYSLQHALEASTQRQFNYFSLTEEFLIF